MSWFIQEPFNAGNGSAWPASFATALTATGSSATQQSGRGRLDPGTNTGYSGDQAMYLNIASQADVEVFCTFRFTASTDQSFEIWVRSTTTSSFDSGTGYFMSFGLGNSTWGMQRANSFSYNAVGTQPSWSPAINTDYKVRFQVIGTSMKVKFWLASAGEPASWTVTATDSSISAAGGIVMHVHGGNGASGTVDIDDLYIGDGGNVDGGSGATWLRRSPRRAMRIPSQAVSLTPGLGTLGIIGFDIQQTRTALSRLPNLGARFLNPDINVQPNDFDASPGAPDDAGVTDPAALSLAFIPPTDSAGVTDPVSVGSGRLPVDSAGVTDSFGILVGPNPVDPASPTDSATFSVAQAPVDSAGVTDPASIASGKPFTDVAVPTDTVSVGVGILPVDVAAPTDSPAVAVGKGALDVLGPTDSATFSVAQAPIDSAGVTDSAARALGTVASDPAGVTDSASIGIGPGASDSAAPTDSASIGSGKGALDPVGPTDAATFIVGKSATDVLGPTDLAALGLDLVATDAGGVSDSTSVGIGKGGVVDAAGLVDSVFVDLQSGELGGEFTDSAGLTDSAIIHIQYSALDDAGVGDSADVLLLQTMTVVDSSGVTDSASIRRFSQRDITVVVTLAAQGRITAELAGQGRVAAILGQRPETAARLAAQGRITVTLAAQGRVSARLGTQP